MNIQVKIQHRCKVTHEGKRKKRGEKEIMVRFRCLEF